MVYASDSETFHRNNPSSLTEQLYLGAYCALSYRLLIDLGITCVINSTLELPTMANQKHDAMQIAVEDRVASKLYVYFDLVADKIHSVHRSGGKVMIYCRAGMSRSASLCIAYFMRHRGMNLEDAFNYVKKCRPIIHPNVGFMRQLREYEAKVLARKSRQKLGLISTPSAAGVKRKHSIAMGRGPLVKGEPLPELEYAEVEISDAIELGILEEIAPRPKPRIHKPKPWIPERLMETYQITTVQVLGDLDFEEPHHVSPNKYRLSASQPQTPHVKHKIRRGRHHSQQYNATLGINQDNVLRVAESRCDTPLIDICCGTVNDGSQFSLQRGAQISPTAPPRRKPFTKISMEPTKIAVSSLTIPMGLCAEFSKGQKLSNFFSRETAISISSHLTGCKGEGVLIAVQEFEEIVFECCSIGLPSDVSSQTVIPSRNPTDTLLLKSSDTNNNSQVTVTSCRNDSSKSSHSLSSSSSNYHHYSQRHHPYSSTSRFSSSKVAQAIPTSVSEKARTVLYQPKTRIAIVSIAHVLECPGVYKKQNLPAGDASSTTSILQEFKQPRSTSSVSKVPTRFASLSTPSSSTFSRSSASRASIKVSAGLKISPLPEKHQKRPEVILPRANDYRVVAIAFQHPIQLEKVEQTEPQKSSKLSSKAVTEVTAISKLYAPSFGVAETIEEMFTMGSAYESVAKDPAANFKVAFLLTVPRRTVLLSSYIEMSDNLPAELCTTDACAFHTIPAKEYPYRTVLLSSAYIQVSDNLPAELCTTDTSELHTIPAKEYPYYSPHHVSYSSSSAANNKLSRAIQEPMVETSWSFNVSKLPAIRKANVQTKSKTDENTNAAVSEKTSTFFPTSTLASTIVPATTNITTKRRLLKEPELRWAAERCQYEPDFMHSKPIPDLPSTCKATLRLITIANITSRGVNHKDQNYNWPLRYDSYSVCNHNEAEMTCLGEFKKNSVHPEGYYTWSIMQMCIHPLYVCAAYSKLDIYQNTNLFCEPTPFFNRAKMVVCGTKSNTKGTIPKRSNYLGVAVSTKVEVIDNPQELIDIPIDVVGNLSEMKKQPQNKNIDEATMLIWLEVFKTSILRARPIYPFVTVSELHVVPTTADENCIIFESVAEFSQHSKAMRPSPALKTLLSNYPSLMMPSVIRARAMPSIVQRQTLKETSNSNQDSQSLSFAVEVSECFCVDVIHVTTGPLKHSNIITRKEKCSESRTYIRDYTRTYWSEPIEEFLVLDMPETLVKPFAKATRAKATEAITTKVPLNIALIDNNATLGEAEQYPVPHKQRVGIKNENNSHLKKSTIITNLERKPFQIISGVRPVAEIYTCETFNADTCLPSYEFIQDIEDQAETSIQDDTTSEWLTCISSPVDTFWYFKLDTPKTKRRDLSLIHSASCEEGNIAYLEDVEETCEAEPSEKNPITESLPHSITGNAKSFQLFLPDPDMIDRLASSFVDEETERHSKLPCSSETNNTPNQQPSISEKIIETKDLIQGSVKERRSKGERRVVIADPPATVVPTESPVTLRKRLGSFGKLMSYQRPREESPQPNKVTKRPHSRQRSRSRSSKRGSKEIQHGKLGGEEQDRQAIQALQSSVQNASYLLDKRRAVGRSSYYGSASNTSYSINDGGTGVPTTTNERGRGRTKEILANKVNIDHNENSNYASIGLDRQRYSSASASITSSGSQDSQSNTSSFRGLLDVAQNWLFNHTSRRERSMETTKALLRKSKL